MKRVRYLVGAVGLAPVAFGMTPAAAGATHAAPTAGHASGKDAGKTVLLVHRSALEPDAAECHTNNPEYGYNNGLYGFTSYNGSCVGYQSAYVYGSKAGLTERVRFWKNGELVTPTRYVNPGTFVSPNGIPRTRFWSSPYEHVSEVCEALVPNGDLGSVKYGPVCERP